MARDINVEKLIDHLDELSGYGQQGVSSTDLAHRMRLKETRIRQRLIDLERRGIVVRTGRTRGTRWHLG